MLRIFPFEWSLTVLTLFLHYKWTIRDSKFDFFTECSITYIGQVTQLTRAKIRVCNLDCTGHLRFRTHIAIRCELERFREKKPFYLIPHNCGIILALYMDRINSDGLWLKPFWAKCRELALTCMVILDVSFKSCYSPQFHNFEGSSILTSSFYARWPFCWVKCIRPTLLHTVLLMRPLTNFCSLELISDFLALRDRLQKSQWLSHFLCYRRTQLES